MDVVELLRKRNENSFLMKFLNLKLVVFCDVPEFQTANKRGEHDQRKVGRGQEELGEGREKGNKMGEGSACKHLLCKHGLSLDPKSPGKRCGGTHF